MKVKWGILGTAGIAKNCTIPGMQKAKNCEVYAIAGRKKEKVDDFANRFGITKRYYDYDSLLDDDEVRAVYVPLPNNIHKEWVIKALNKGKYVLCEKPVAMNADEAAEMYKAARDNNRILMEAFAYLHSPYVESLKKDVQSGIIGDVTYIDTSFVTQGYKEDFRLHKELGGGMIYDLGCYCTTLILSLIDSPVKYVKSSAEMTELGVDALSVAIIGFENGARAAFTVGMVLGENSNCRYDRLYIHGTKGDIISEVPYNGDGNVNYRIVVNGGTTVRNITVPNNYTLEAEDLSECILNGTKPLISEEFSMKNARLLDALLESAGY